MKSLFNRNFVMTMNPLLILGVSVLLSGCSIGFMSAKSTTDNQTTGPTRSLAADLVPTKLQVTGPFALNLKSCVGPFTVTTRSSKNVESGVNGDLIATLSSSAAGTFYADKACANALTSVVVQKQTSQTQFYYKPTVVADGRLTASAPNFKSTGAEFSTRRVVDHLAITSTLNTVTYGLCAPDAIRVTTRDIEKKNFSSGAAIHITMNKEVVAYADTACNNPLFLNTKTLTGAETSFTFSVRAVSEANLDIKASSIGVIDGNISVGVNHIATGLKLNSLAGVSVNVGICSSGFSVGTVDGLGADFPVSANTTVNLSAPKGYFYSDSNCGTQISSVVISSGSNTSPSIYYKTTVPNTTSDSVTASASGLNQAVGSLLVVHRAVAVKFNTLPVVNVGVCSSSALTVSSIDALAVNRPVESLTTVNLAAGAGKFYSDSSCSNLISTVQLNPSSATSGPFYFKTMFIATSDALSASATGLGSDSKNITVTHLATSLVFSNLPTPNVGVCSTGITVSSRDGLDLNFPVSATTIVNLSSSLSGSGFYSDSSCINSISSVLINGGSDSSATVYFKVNSVVSTLNLTATASGLTGVTTPMAVVHLPVSIRLWTLPAAVVGVCTTGFRVAVLDGLSQPLNSASSLSIGLGAGNGTIFSDSSCNTPISSTTVAANDFQTPLIYYKTHAVITSDTVTATSSTLGTSSRPITVSRVAIALSLSLPSTIVIGQCTSALTVGSLDGQNPRQSFPVGSDTLVSISVNTGSLYADPSCVNAISGTNAATIPAGQAVSGSLYYKTSAVNVPTLNVTASASSLSSATQSITLTRLALGLDNIFGTAGKTIKSLSSPGEGLAVAYQPSTRGYIVAGYNTDPGNPRAFLSRFNSQGNFDTGFGSSSGFAVLNLGGTSVVSQAKAVLVNGSSIYVAGVMNAGGTTNNDFFVAKLDANGQQGTSGTWFLPMDGGTSEDDEATALGISSDGSKLFVAGNRIISGVSHFAVMTVNSSDGSGAVMATKAAGLAAVAKTLTVVSSGKIWVAGSGSNGTNDDFALARFNSNGSEDTGFNSGNLLLVDFSGTIDQARSVLVQSTGKLVLVGNSGLNLAMVRLDGSTFAVDSSFGSSGKVLDTGAAMGALNDASGNVLSFGSSSSDMFIRRYTSGGALDTSASLSQTTIKFTQGSSVANGGLVQADGNIVLAGTVANGLGIVRLLP